jgi:hypothetical protein
MPSFVTFYAYAFEGAPRASASPPRGWFDGPGLGHGIALRARTALGRATSDRLAIFRCHGRIDRPLLDEPSGAIVCEDVEPLFEGRAVDSLWWFTLYCARSVAHRWQPPALVREFLQAGRPALRQIAHRCAWAASLGLDGVPRLAARVAMYATSDDRATHAAREACRLAAQIGGAHAGTIGKSGSADAGDRLRQVATHQERALASALLASVSPVSPARRSSDQTLGAIPDMRPTPQWGRDLAA